MSYEDHQKHIMRRQNEEIARKTSEGAGEAITEILSLLWLGIIYLPFVIIAVVVGRYVSYQWNFQFLPAAIVSLLAAVVAYFLIDAIETFSDRLKNRGNYWYVLLKIFVLVAVAGAPFILGYQLGASAVDGYHPWQKVLAGSFMGLAFGAPAYSQVILTNKEGY